MSLNLLGRSWLIFLCLFLALCISCSKDSRIPRFLLEKLPETAFISKSTVRNSGDSDFIAILKINSSFNEFEKYLQNLKLDTSLHRHYGVLPWDSGEIEWWDLDDYVDNETKWYYFSDSERRKIVAEWRNGKGYIQYETF